MVLVAMATLSLYLELLSLTVYVMCVGGRKDIMEKEGLSFRIKEEVDVFT